MYLYETAKKEKKNGHLRHRIADTYTGHYTASIDCCASARRYISTLLRVIRVEGLTRCCYWRSRNSCKNVTTCSVKAVLWVIDKCGFTTNHHFILFFVFQVYNCLHILIYSLIHFHVCNAYTWSIIGTPIIYLYIKVYGYSLLAKCQQRSV